MIVILTVFIFSGCGGSKGYNQEKNQIAQALSGFEGAVEAYYVTGMLAVFDDTDTSKKILTIQEGGSKFEKSYTTLEEELKDDADDQLAWRQPSSVPGGHGYQLDMRMGPYTYSGMSATGGFATQFFEVWETAEGFGEWLKTDHGTITWELAKVTGEWKVVSMVIVFNPLTSVSSQSLSVKSVSVKNSGFGFGKGYLNLAK